MVDRSLGPEADVRTDAEDLKHDHNSYSGSKTVMLDFSQTVPSQKKGVAVPFHV
jgi:hypothetical protein